MDTIIEIVNGLISLLEQDRRIKDIFNTSSNIKEENRTSDNIVSELDSNELFNDLYNVLSNFITYEPIETIKYNRQHNERDENSFEIVERARYLSTLLSIKERDESIEIQRLFNNLFVKYRLVYLKCLLLIYLCSSSYECDYSVENLSLVKSRVVGDIFYRGHSDIKFTIVPSMIRSLGKSCRIDYQFIYKKYSDNNLLDKYKKCVDSLATVDYNFCSFIQHATSYSPLIDFTRDLNVALSFASYPNGNLNMYNSTDASLIMLAIKSDKDYIDIKNIDLDYHATRLSLNSLIYGKPLYKCTLQDFDVSFGLSTKATNDRMKYQNGVFFCFYRCVIVKGVPLIPWSKGYLMTFRIKAKDNAKSPLDDKSTIYNKIIAIEPYLEYKHLMNPYDYFGEYNK